MSHYFKGGLKVYGTVLYCCHYTYNFITIHTIFYLILLVPKSSLNNPISCCFLICDFCIFNIRIYSLEEKKYGDVCLHGFIS